MRMSLSSIWTSTSSGSSGQTNSDAKDVCGGMTTCPDDAATDRANSLADKAKLFGNVSTLMIGVGAAALVTGAVLYFTAPKSGSGDEHALMFVPTADGAMVSFSGAL